MMKYKSKVLGFYYGNIESLIIIVHHHSLPLIIIIIIHHHHHPPTFAHLQKHLALW